MRVKWWYFMWLIFTGCVEPFELENNGTEEQLVVEGLISNAQGPYEVKLSTSSPIDHITYQPLGDCNVYIEDEEGNRYIMDEASSGVYLSDSAALRGEVGKAYRLIITTPEGVGYESSWERIQSPVAIEDIRAESALKEDPDSPFPRYGYQFYLDAATTEEDTVNLIWHVDATYEYRADFKIDFYYDGVVRPFPDRDIWYVCYRTYRVPDFFAYSTAAEVGAHIRNQALHFEDTRTRALTHKYALNVYQLRVNDEAFAYWDDLKTLKELQGQVFDRQPFQVNGNVSQSEDATHKALGYFMAAGVSHRLEFFEWNEGKWAYPECVITDVETMAYGDIFRSRPSQWPIYITTGGGGPRAVVADPCIDCRLKGGVLEKPSFWE